MKFKFKLNPLHFIFAFIILTFIVCNLYLVSESKLASISLMSTSIIVLLSIYTSTYEITDKGLVVKYIWINKEIPFDEIRHLRYSGKSLKSDKWSMQRIEIMYGMYETYVTGIPKEEEKFLRILQEKCPQMKIIDRPETEQNIIGNVK